MSTCQCSSQDPSDNGPFRIQRGFRTLYSVWSVQVCSEQHDEMLLSFSLPLLFSLPVSLSSCIVIVIIKDKTHMAVTSY